MKRRLLDLLAASNFLRRLFALGSAVSGVLLVAVLTVWVRSYYRVDALIYQPRIDGGLHLYRVTWVRGRLSMGMFEAENLAQSRLYWDSFVPNPNPVGAAARVPDEFRFLGVGLLRRTENKWHRLPASRVLSTRPYTTVRELEVSLPCWQAAVLSACLPASWLLRRRRRHIEKLRSDRGQCVRCGYDLRASTGRCPECGTAATTST